MHVCVWVPEIISWSLLTVRIRPRSSPKRNIMRTVQSKLVDSWDTVLTWYTPSSSWFALTSSLYLKKYESPTNLIDSWNCVLNGFYNLLLWRGFRNLRTILTRSPLCQLQHMNAWDPHDAPTTNHGAKEYSTYLPFIQFKYANPKLTHIWKNKNKNKLINIMLIS